MQVEVGSIVEGKVAKITNYGAFVDIDGGGTGMIHISEVANTYVKDINDHLKVGELVKVKVIGINPENKVSLSIKATQEAPAPAPRPQGQQRQGAPRGGFGGGAPRSFNRSSSAPSTGDPFEDMMNRFKKSSDDRMSDLRKVADPKRGTGRRSNRG
ncbi:MAG: S1 RNA-binding domain-containing protein [Angelakisella sp.]|nr:S1 RNA-binding domain-containing protein [Angelakisella sp.]